MKKKTSRLRRIHSLLTGKRKSDADEDCPHGHLFLICHVCRPPSPEMLALAQKAVEAQEARDKMLAAMTPEERKAYTEEWISRLANELAQFTD